MSNGPTVLHFSVREILPEIRKVLEDNGLDYPAAQRVEVYQYVLSRALESIYQACFVNYRDPRMDYLYDLVQSRYERRTDIQSFSLLQDVGSNKLFYVCGSSDFHFESELLLIGHVARIAPRGFGMHSERSRECGFEQLGVVPGSYLSPLV